MNLKITNPLARTALKIMTFVVIPFLGLAVFHELLVVGASLLLHSVFASSWMQTLVTQLPVNPNYARMMIAAIADINPRGIAIFNQNPVMAIVLESTPLARFLSQAGVEIAIMTVGIFLIGRGARVISLENLLIPRSTKSIVLVAWGFFLESQALATIVSYPLLSGTLEDMGANFVVGPLTAGNIWAYNLLMASVIPGITKIVIVAFGFAGLLWLKTITTAQKAAMVIALISFASLWSSLQLPPYLGMVPGKISSSEPAIKLTPIIPKNEVIAPLPKVTATPEIPPPTPLPTAALSLPTILPIGQDKRTAVKLDFGAAGEFKVLINETPSTIRGVHYFFGDTVKKSPEEREKILRRDLAIIKTMGFVAVTGWEEKGFDGLFLRLAADQNLLVVKPIALTSDPNDERNGLVKGDFLDPIFRKAIKDRVVKVVSQDKASPTLVLWNIGADEPIEQMTRHYKRTPDQVQAAANLIVELATLVHQIDPNHPTIVSEPQDWHLGYYTNALDKVRTTGGDPRLFFTVGGNFYTPRSFKTDAQRTKDAVTAKLNVGFAVMEWAPFGIDRQDRPRFRASMANDIATITPISMAYVFNPAVDQLNYMPDPTLAIVTGLSLTDVERTDNNGILTMLADTLGNPSFPTALQILKADQERGWSGVPVSYLVPQETGVAMYFIGTDTDGKKTAYRWILSDRTNSLIGPQTVDEIVFDITANHMITLKGNFLRFYLDTGGPFRFGIPTADVYETAIDGQKVLRQDFSRGWSLIQK